MIHDAGGDGRPRAVVFWSTGKDAAFALHEVQQAGVLEVVGLVTTISRPDNRVAMHGIAEGLLDRQVAATGLPVHKIVLPWPCPNAIYEREVKAALGLARRAGVTHAIFGDLFLADIRAYREALIGQTGVSPVFPLWGRDTAALAHDMLAAGVEAILACVDPTRVATALAGRRYDEAVLAELGPEVDPCGENGEFHTFVTAGPMLRERMDVTAAGTFERDGLVYAELVLAADASTLDVPG